VTEKALEYNFTNEGGVYGTWRLLKNIMGLWILQESQAQWQREGQTYSWSDITAMGQEADPFRSLIDPDDLRFLDAGNMPSRIKAICKETNQPIPESDSQVVRCVLESLALKYRFQLNRLEDIIGHSLPVIHMVGGGIQNELLCQWTANACDRETMAGPVEATALGNVGVQLIAGGHIKNLAAFRELVARSEPIKTYHPEDSSAWNKAFDQFKALIP
jgi:rhamnulokinase